MLLNRAFHVPEGRSFFDDFPIWDESIVPSDESLVRLGVFSANRHELLASAGVRMARLKMPGGLLPVALIGAVATDERYRGAGLASSLVSLAVEWAESRNASVVLLWGSEHSLYRRLGFELCGEQILIPLDQIPIAEKPATLVCSGWDESIFHAMKQREGGLILNDKDLKWIVAQRSVQWFWTRNGQDCDAYIAIGRGIDLQGFVHEWGGDPKALHRLLHWLKKETPELTLLGSSQILRRFQIDPHLGKVESLCLARVLDSGAPVARQLNWPHSVWIWGLDAV
jgi:GNAT superfamily N-acetyltransferase